MGRENRDEILLNGILELCKDLKRIPTNEEIKQAEIMSCGKSINNLCKRNGYENKDDFCRRNGYGKSGDVYVNGVHKEVISLTTDECKKLWLEFRDECGKFPTSEDCNNKTNNLPYWEGFKIILKKSDYTVEKFYSEMCVTTMVAVKSESYDYYVERYINISRQRGKFLNRTDLIHNKHRLPNSRWFVENCPNKNVTNYNQFVEWCGFVPSENVSKERVIKAIKEMQMSLDRPLIYDDFRNPKPDEVGVGAINKYWGSLNKMKTALGLDIIKEDMVSRRRCKDEMLRDLQFFIEELGRIPYGREINENPNILSEGAYVKYFGGLNNAIIKLGYTPNKKSISRKMTNDEIKDVYKEFIIKNGFTPTHQYCKDTYLLPSPATVTRRFNCTWNEFIENLGFNTNKKMKRSLVYAKDGTLCLSASECIVHNYLLSKNIKNFQKEVLYNEFLTDKNISEEAGLRRCDWIFYDKNDNLKIVEYFGLVGVPEYDKKLKKKIDLIKRDGLADSLIAIYPKDLSRLDEVFNFKNIN